MHEISFGQWIKHRRKELSLTQEELALHVGCSLVLIQKIEEGERRPSTQIAELLAQQLAIQPDERLEFIRFARMKDTLIPSGQSAPWRDLRQHYTNLPVQSTPFFGRELAVGTIKQRLLHEKVRLLSLVGPPGTGKTRLAIEAATQLVNDYDDGVFILSLAPITDSELVLTALAHTFNIKEIAHQPLIERMKQELSNKRLLLLLDNMEQVMTAAPLVADLLATCPWLQILATSRVPLHIRAERQFHVEPLALAPIPMTPEPKFLLHYSAVALFVDRAQAVDPDFALTGENASCVAEICAHLDGLPLAIELIATLANQTTLPELLAQVNQPLEPLTTGPYDLPVRHQTLRNAIRWSYDLLNPEEQKLYTRLAIFAGGCTPEMANFVCGLNSQGHFIDAISRLVDKSLVIRQEVESHSPRFTMLETIREYALERLVDNGEAKEIRERYAVCIRDLAGRSDPSQKARLDRLEIEHDNLRAVLHWAIDCGAAEIALGLCAALWEFWQLHGYLNEGLTCLTASLNLQKDSPDPALTLLRAKALLGQGWLLRDAGDFIQMKLCFEESLALFNQTEEQSDYAYAFYSAGYAHFLMGDSRQGIQMIRESLILYRGLNHAGGIALALFMLGRIAIGLGNYNEASNCLEDCLKVEKERGSMFGIARTLGSLGELAIYQGDQDRANSYLNESLERLTNLGEKQLSAWVLTKRGELAWREERLAEAYDFFQQSLQLARAFGYKWNIAYTLTYLGLTALSAGDTDLARENCAHSLRLFQELDSEGDIAQTKKDLARVLLQSKEVRQAEDLYRQSLEVFVQRGYKPDVVECLEGLAEVRLAQGDVARSASLLGTAQGWREILAAPRAPGLNKNYEGLVNEIRSQLGQLTFDDLWNQGLSFSRDPFSKGAIDCLVGLNDNS